MSTRDEQPRKEITNYETGQRLWKFTRPIGKGSFGAVYLVYGTNPKTRRQEQMCLKEVAVNGDDAKEVVREVDVLKSVDHEHIVRLLGSWCHQDRLCILMEYCEYKSLETMIIKQKPVGALFPKSWVESVFTGVAKALSYLHLKNIVHRDLKTDNVLVDAFHQAKIADFGLSVMDRNNAFMETFAGTPIYMAPEILQEQPYNEKVDIWAFGCIMYNLMALKPPWQPSTRPTARIAPFQQLRVLVTTSSPDFSSFEAHFTGNNMVKAVQAMLCVQPGRRPSAEALERITSIQELSQAAFNASLLARRASDNVACKASPAESQLAAVRLPASDLQSPVVLHEELFERNGAFQGLPPPPPSPTKYDAAFQLEPVIQEAIVVNDYATMIQRTWRASVEKRNECMERKWEEFLQKYPVNANDVAAANRVQRAYNPRLRVLPPKQVPMEAEIQPAAQPRPRLLGPKQLGPKRMPSSPQLHKPPMTQDAAREVMRRSFGRRQQYGRAAAPAAPRAAPAVGQVVGQVVGQPDKVDMNDPDKYGGGQSPRAAPTHVPRNRLDNLAKPRYLQAAPVAPVVPRRVSQKPPLPDAVRGYARVPPADPRPAWL